ETDLRQGMLKVAQRLLEKWANVADLAVPRPGCPQCGVPMRHKGRLPASMMTTLGEVAYRRPRWRCADCRQERYPHDDVLCCLGHRVSWALAKVASRMAAQLGSFEEARDTLADDYRVHLAKETIRDVAETSGQHVVKQEDELQAHPGTSGAVAGERANTGQSLCFCRRHDRAYRRGLA